MPKPTGSCCGTNSNETSDGSFQRLIPADKHLSPDWLSTLFEKGEPERYSGRDLDYIGMPIGGICTGQVYLGGDGQLWHWDVFKAYGGGYDGPIDPRGFHYPRPMTQSSPIEQGFAVRIKNAAGENIRTLNRNGFSDIEFEGRYPLGCVRFKDASFPVDVELNAYSPFIPLDEERSSLPVTVLEYTVTNTSDSTVEVSVAGWLENLVCRYSNQAGKGLRRNTVQSGNFGPTLTCTAEATETSDPATLDAYGDMSLRLMGASGDVSSCPLVPGGHSGKSSYAEKVFQGLNEGDDEKSSLLPFGESSVGALAETFELPPGESKTVRFAISWYFPKYTGGKVFFFSMEDIPNLEQLKRFYASKFASSGEVLDYLSEHFDELSGLTKRWVETWYDSTLPYWLLNRVGANFSTLASQTCHWFDTGRFYCWEGVDCCPGTCQHVWQYAHTISRLFPGLERRLRKDIDYGIAYCSDGSISYRGEAGIGEVNMKQESAGEAFFATDGQLGTILRVYREHSMSADSGFLEGLWPKVRKSLEFMMTKDENGDGLLDGSQFHTLDTNWYGEIPWISSLYLAALAAGKVMASEMGDLEFSEECQRRLVLGRENLVGKLFNGEYFVHRADPDHPDSMDLAEGSYIDQVFGQSYAQHLGLERVIPKSETISALEALWKYNFTPDVGPYREEFADVKGGRWYAMPGEGGLVMCTWPKGDCNRADHEQTLLALDVTSEGYLNECMSGFEYQVAGHMVAEGLVEKGLAVARTVHDRYHPSKRNPYNEIECSDHYSRAMASYAVFVNACGYHYHGPQKRLSFSPKIDPGSFRAPFTAAEGWGTFAQSVANRTLTVSLTMAYGRLSLRTLILDDPEGVSASEIKAKVGDAILKCNLERTDVGRLQIQFFDNLNITDGETLTVTIG